MLTLNKPTTSPSKAPERHDGRSVSYSLLTIVFVLAMGTAVLGAVGWKAVEGRRSTLARSEIDARNLAHSLAEHAANSVKAVELTMNGMVDLLKYQNPLPERFNAHLAATVQTLPQLMAFNVLDQLGNIRYSSVADKKSYSLADRDYFAYHRDNPDRALQISKPLVGRYSGTSNIVLSRRINLEDGQFGGVLVAAVSIQYFSDFYKTFDLGSAGGISLIRSDGIVMIHSPSGQSGTDLSKTILFQDWIRTSTTGYRKVPSAFDGISKYFAYEKSDQYPLLVTVAQSEADVLSPWRKDLNSDVAVAAFLLAVIGAMAVFMRRQINQRLRMERARREREAQYRLLADNIADIIIRLDRQGTFLFVSPSVKTILGRAAEDLIGLSCFEMVHPDDVNEVKAATARLSEMSSVAVTFRTYRSDRTLVWVEINYRLAPSASNPDQVEIVGVLRDVTQRRKMEDELTSLNARLSQLASHDGLTGLANRRTLDVFMQREYAKPNVLSVLMIDIDHFKGFNDSVGHLAGDGCIKSVAQVLANLSLGVEFLSARYGGEEFVVVLPGTSATDACRIAETIRLQVRALAIPHLTAERGIVSVSIGISTRADSLMTERDLINEADIALYQAKREGRDRSIHISAPGAIRSDRSIDKMLMDEKQINRDNRRRTNRQQPGADDPENIARIEPAA